MKRYGIIILLFFILSLIAVWMAGADQSKVSYTKHNLSTTGTGSYKSDEAGGTTEICVFCHTPHGGNTDAPLWNRVASVATYNTYTSDVLAALNYPAAEDPSNTGAAGYDVHVKTRICLSCHDGTIAMGRVVNLPHGLIDDIPILNAPGGQMPTGAAGYIGEDLSDDHPVAIVQDNDKDHELRIPPTAGVDVRLYYKEGTNVAYRNPSSTAQIGDYVECTSCHDVHTNYYGNFLRDSNAGSQICTSCHNKEIGVVVGAHDSSSASYNPNGSAPGTPAFIGDKVGGVSGVKCMNCHYPHRAGATGASQPWSTYTNPKGGQYLLTFQEENTCFNYQNSQNRWGQSLNVCHASGALSPTNGGGDIQSQENKTPGYAAHNVAKSGANYAGKHQAMEAVVGGTNGYGWLTVSTNWHVQCNDCHNPHTAGSVRHNTPGNAIGNTSPLYGAGGVSVAWPGVPKWTAPALSSQYSAFESLGLTDSKAASMPTPYAEYQICFKCHSSFAWGFGSKPSSPSLGGLSTMTDQAQEFNPANTYANGASAHPIAGVTGHVAGTLKSPWNGGGNPGNQTMYCSDCHGTTDVAPASQGPHGSGSKFGDNPPINPGFILVSDYTDTYSTTKANAQPMGDLCFICHDPDTYLTNVDDTYNRLGTGFSDATNNLHLRHRTKASSGVSNYAYRCVNCHTRVPHGYQRKAMIVVKNEPGGGAPYEAGATGMGKIDSVISLPGTGAYTAINANCTTVSGCHQP